jgi:hypothetical protein
LLVVGYALTRFDCTNSKSDFDDLLRALTQKLIVKFKKTTGCNDTQEAMFYLEQADFALEQAVSLKTSDDAWEASNAVPALPQLELEYDSGEAATRSKIAKRRCCMAIFG